MTIITRRENEGIVIGDDLFVTVLEVQDDHVRLAFQSSSPIPSYWEETLYIARADSEDEVELEVAEVVLEA